MDVYVPNLHFVLAQNVVCLVIINISYSSPVISWLDMLQFMQSRTKINNISPAQLIRQRASTQIDPAQQHQLARRCSICFFPDRIAKWCGEIRQVLRMFLGKL
ncbi:uncharacterized protein [Lolium perenne]|uniref:uncharacterized protein n=1 Tax=Lolium perenne TaxID=4522 RepID=UPI0021F569CF|nr:uncharacterized protein LOC127342017 [Lolium perenne]